MRCLEFMKITEITLLSSQISGNQNGAGLLLETADLKEYVNNQLDYIDNSFYRSYNINVG